MQIFLVKNAATPGNGRYQTSLELLEPCARENDDGYWSLFSTIFTKFKAALQY